MCTKLNFYSELVYGDKTNFIHHDEKMQRKIHNKLRFMSEQYQNIINRHGFIMIPKSLKHLDEFGERCQQIADDIEILDFFNYYFAYGYEQLEQYLTLGFVDEELQEPLETALSKCLNQLQDFTDEELQGLVIKESTKEDEFDLLPFGFDEAILSREQAKEICEAIEENNREPEPVEDTPLVKEADTNRIITNYPKYNYYTDIIGEQEIYENCKNPYNHIILNGGVGTGKTTLSKQLARYFYLQGYTIIYLGNRKKLVNQTDMNKEETIDDIWETETDIFGDIVFKKWTYQTFTSDWFNWEYDLTKKYFFVMDEIHYCYADAGFNFDTVKMLEFIQEYQDKATFCLISASAERFFDELTTNYCQDSTFYQYYIPDNFDHIKNFCYFYKKDQVKPLIEDCINNNKKMIYFTNDLETWEWFNNNYKKHCCFVQTEYEPNKEEDIKHWKRWRKRQDMIEKTDSKDSYHSSSKKDYFDKSILVATSTLDNGVSIIDNDIKYVVIDFKLNATSTYQAIGRIRANEETSIDVFFKIMSSAQYDVHCQDHFDNVDLEQIKENECYRKNWRIHFELDLQIKRQYQETNNFHESMMSELFYKTVFREQEVNIIDTKDYLKQVKIENKVNSEQQRRIDLIEDVLEQKLTTAQFKELAEQLNFRDKHRKLIKKPWSEIEALGYTVQQPTNSKRYTLISK